MGLSALSNAGTCRHCGKSLASAPRQYLNLEPLCIHELPPHAEISQHQGSPEATLAGFITSVLGEAYRLDFEDASWSDHGTYPPKGNHTSVTMPSLSTARDGSDTNISITVEKWAKGNGSSAWLGRRSYHAACEIDYPELDTLLAQNHCRKEAEYTPSIYDAHELLKWDAEDLKKAVAELKPEWGVTKIQISIFQMFHEMPKVLGISVLQDRVFHVLCITTHSTYGVVSPNSLQGPSQSHTVQLPFYFKSLCDVQTVMSKSHIRPGSLIYDNKHDTITQVEDAERKVKHNGNSLTEGVYVSLERLRQASTGTEKSKEQHRWDMITRSDAKGITRAAPWSTKKKEILEAVAKDVQYIIEHIGEQRKAIKGNT
ncbi:hypothetical protein GQ44DRAFT_604193 [Phaeosphaeriaceae sp. PMI808]|nr:hypothetical protein GQ44DRAFT_604193 [Phaeosphaeriaceae sp. PMI808]